MSEGPVPSSSGEVEAPGRAEEHALVSIGSVVTLRRMLMLLLVIVTIAALWAGRAILIPVTAGVMLMFLCKPLVQRLHRTGLWLHASAAIVVGGLSVVIFAGVFFGAEPTLDWVENLPQKVREGRARLVEMEGPWTRIMEAQAQIEKIAAEGEAPAPEVKVRESGYPMLDVGLTFAGSLVIIVVLCYFLLVYWDDFLLNLVHMAPGLRQKKAIVTGFRQIESGVSRYLMYRTAINAGLGLAAWAAFEAIGLPEAGLWAMVGAVFNFVPYIGAFAAFCLIALASLLAFDAPADAAVAPLVFAALTTIEGFIVSPVVFGSRLKLNPVVVLLGLVFWGWLWGIPGALMAVPLIVCIRIALEQVPALRPMGDLMTSQRGDPGIAPDPDPTAIGSGETPAAG